MHHDQPPASAGWVIPRLLPPAAFLFLCALPPVVAQDSPLDRIVARARAVVVRYAREAEVLMADETCDQKAFIVRSDQLGQRVDPEGRRRWKAEYALVGTPEVANAGYPWVEYRDVNVVDGRRLPDRAGRLMKLLLQPGGWTREAGHRIAEESMTFNIGPVARSWNLPAVALFVLHPANESRFSLRLADPANLDPRTVKIAYSEQLKPTLIATTGRKDCPASGELIIDRATGEVVKSVLRLSGSSGWDAEMTVTYKRHDRFGLPLPVEMRERCNGDNGRQWVEGVCKHTNYRRFETRARLIEPK